MTEKNGDNCICPVCGGRLGLEPFGICDSCGFNILEDSFCVTQKLSDKEKNNYISFILYDEKKREEELERKRIISEAYKKRIEEQRQEKIRIEKEKEKKESLEKEKKDREAAKKPIVLDTEDSNSKNTREDKGSVFLDGYSLRELKRKQEALKEKKDLVKYRKNRFIFGSLKLFNLCMMCFFLLWLFWGLTDGMPAFLPDFSVTHKCFFFMFAVLCVDEIVNAIIMSIEEQGDGFWDQLIVLLIVIAEIILLILLIRDNIWIFILNDFSVLKWFFVAFWCGSSLGMSINTWRSSDYYDDLPEKRLKDEITRKWDDIVTTFSVCLIISCVVLFIFSIIIGIII